MLVLLLCWVNTLIGLCPSILAFVYLMCFKCSNVVQSIWANAYAIWSRPVTVTGVPLVELFLFRSWLPDEIAADLRYLHVITFQDLIFTILKVYFTLFYRTSSSGSGCSCILCFVWRFATTTKCWTTTIVLN